MRPPPEPSLPAITSSRSCTVEVTTSQPQRLRKKKKAKWLAEHKDFELRYGLADVKQQELSDHLLLEYPGLSSLTPRQLDMLRLRGVTCFPAIEQLTIPLEMSVKRLHCHKDAVPTIAPGSRIFLAQRCRFLHAFEALRLQGVWLDRSYMESFNRHLLADLAGNSFETGCCLAVLLSTMVGMANGASVKCTGAPSRPRYAAPAPATEPESDDSDSAEPVLRVRQQRRIF